MAPVVTCAAERGWYLGAAYSDISPDLPESSIVFSEVRLEDAGYKAFVGYRAFSWLAVEADYGDFGDTHEVVNFICFTIPCPVEINTSTTAVSVSALGLYSPGDFDLFARVGFSSWRAEVDVRTTTPGSVAFATNVRDDGTDVLFGAGAQYNFRRIIARVEYERFEFGSSEADVWSVGLAYRFF